MTWLSLAGRGAESHLPDSFVHFKHNSKTSPRGPISIFVIQVTAQTTVVNTYSLMFSASLPLSAVSTLHLSTFLRQQKERR